MNLTRHIRRTAVALLAATLAVLADRTLAARRTATTTA